MEGGSGRRQRCPYIPLQNYNETIDCTSIVFSTSLIKITAQEYFNRENMSLALHNVGAIINSYTKITLECLITIFLEMDKI